MLLLKITNVRSRVEPEIKDSATQVLAQCGLSLSEGIRLFTRQVIESKGLPFEVKVPNAKTLAAMEEAQAINKARRARFKKADELMHNLADRYKRALLPLHSDYTKQFEKDWKWLTHSGRTSCTEPRVTFRF